MNKNKFIMASLSLLAFYPMWETIKAEQIVGIGTIVLYFIYAISFLFDYQNVTKYFAMFSMFGGVYIAYMQNNINILLPLSLYIFVAKNVDTDDDENNIKAMSVILIFASVLLGIKQEEILNVVSVFGLIFGLYNIKYCQSVQVDNYELEKAQEEIEELHQKLQKTQKEAKDSLSDEKLQVIIGLEFDSYDLKKNIQTTLEAINSTAAVVFTAYYEVKEENLELVSSIGDSSLLSKKSVPLGRGLIGGVTNSGQPIIVTNMQEKQTDTLKRQLMNGVDTFLAEPIFVNNKIVGVLTIGIPKIGSKSKEKELCSLFTMIAQRVSIEMTKLDAHKQVEKVSITDKLTGLYNRTYFDKIINENFEKIQLEGQNMAYILLDLDFFKQMNDTHGHDFGDKVLKTAAETMKENIRNTDYAFRTGGDEFSLLLMGADKSIAEAITEKIADAYAEKVEKYHLYAKKDGEDVKSSFSIGGAIAPNKHAKNPAELIKLADRAVYVVKENGKNDICIVG